MSKWLRNNVVTLVSVVFLAGAFYSSSRFSEQAMREEIDELNDEIVLLKEFQAEQEALNINVADRVRNNEDNLEEAWSSILFVRCSVFGSGHYPAITDSRLRLLMKMGDCYVAQERQEDSSIGFSGN